MNTAELVGHGPTSQGSLEALNAARLVSDFAHLGPHEAADLFMAAARLSLRLPAGRHAAEPPAPWAMPRAAAGATPRRRARGGGTAAGAAEAVQALVDAAAYQPFDARLAASMSKSIEALFAGTQWLTAAELGRAYQPAARNVNAIPSRWRSQGKVFAVDHRGHLIFPRYQFDARFEPLPGLAEVLRALAGLTPLAVASWFESPNSALGARRPRELLASEPQRVAAAAADHVQGPVHG